jgi:hypothetical protein
MLPFFTVFTATVVITFERGGLGKTIVKRNTNLQGKHPQETRPIREAKNSTWNMTVNELNLLRMKKVYIPYPKEENVSRLG